MYSMPWHVVWLDDSDLWCNMHGSHQALPYHKELSSLQNPFWSQLRRAGSIGVVISWVKRILQKHLASIANFVARCMFMHTLNASLLVSVALGRFRFGAEWLHHCNAEWDRQTGGNAQWNAHLIPMKDWLNCLTFGGSPFHLSRNKKLFSGIRLGTIFPVAPP